MSHANGKEISANELTRAILLRLPREFPCRVWRRNTGSGYGIEAVRRAARLMVAGKLQAAAGVLNTIRPIKFGQKGEADITGILNVEGRGIRLEIEVKAGDDRLSNGQKSFKRMIEAHGGIYVEARSVEQTIDYIGATVASIHLRSLGERLLTDKRLEKMRNAVLPAGNGEPA